MPPKSSAPGKTVETLTHDEARRFNIPTTELSSVARKEDLRPVEVSYKRRDPDLDPQLIWRGKYDADGMEDGEMLVRAAPLYIQEKVHPKVLIDDLKRESEARAKKNAPPVPQQLSLFADFNGIPEGVDKTEFYRHEQNWSNRLILGDSLQVMAGLAEREGLRGKVQCIYFDPPYGIKFNSNFQWSTTSRDVKDNKADHITREPEQVKAFRDTWKDGIHSYLSYIRDRLIVARDLLTESGSIFVQIGDENVHRVRAVMDEVFGEENFIAQISFQKTGSLSGNYLGNVVDYLVWFSNDKSKVKYRALFTFREAGSASLDRYDYVEGKSGILQKITASAIREEKELPIGERCRLTTLLSDGAPLIVKHFLFQNFAYPLRHNKHWKTDPEIGGQRLAKATRVIKQGQTIWYKRYVNDFSVLPLDNRWDSVQIGRELTYVVQTASEVISRCLLMTTDPGDLVLDPTCGSGTTAYVAEQWGRRWITIDTSRVALALARARLMGARYPYYLLADSPEGQKKEAEITKTEASSRPAYGKISHGFVYERVPHITLKSIANNAEIDVIWEKWQEKLEPLREKLHAALSGNWEEWEMPREADAAWPEAAQKLHAEWWSARIARQREIDASIAARADTEYLYDKPYTDNSKVRVAGPFTVESLSPHRMLTVDENDEIIDPLEQTAREGGKDFTAMILEELKSAGVQQASKEDKINFDSLLPWPGSYICGEGRYAEGDNERRAAIFIGPEFGSVQRQDLVAAAREASDADFDLLIACAFNFDAASADLANLGRIRILKARMNADLHMSTELKNTGKGNLFIIFGEPDIEIAEAGNKQIQVSIKGVDVFDPARGEVRSDEPDNIACWFIDTDYNEESFFVRHAYFLGAGDPYTSLKTTLKAEIDQEAWESLRSDTSRPFDKPKSGRIAVKVINHLGDEVMKVYRIS
ncbi:MAG: site-specific DNA-methyltransferase [Deltaproteobacteria bacterium]|jgi:adenine-specific DNA-methyltransferase|nr:site-specific DNA-methyltransferase [Deltaproteobacteria bacterium]